LKQKWLLTEGNANLEDNEWEGYLKEKETERSKAKVGSKNHTRLTAEI
jgi:hypothetical protein